MVSDEVVIKIVERLNEVGSNVVVEYIGVQQFIGLMNVVMTIVGAVLFVVSMYIGYRIGRRDEYSYPEDGLFLGIVLAVVVLVVYVCIWCALQAAVVKIMFPEYAGVKELISDIFGG